MARLAQMPKTIPAIAPIDARTRLSIRNRCARRQRDAPSATWTLSSCRRAAPRASIRLAMFAQAMTSTSATTMRMVINGRSNRCRNGDLRAPTGTRTNGSFRNDRASCPLFGIAAARICGCTARRAAVAASSDCPCLNRSVMLSHTRSSVSGVAGCTKGWPAPDRKCDIEPPPYDESDELRRRDPNYRDRRAIDDHSCANGARCCTEPRLPQSIADHGGQTVRPGARDVVGRRQSTAEDGGDAKRPEVVAADELMLHRPGVAAVREVRLSSERPRRRAVELI